MDPVKSSPRSPNGAPPPRLLLPPPEPPSGLMLPFTPFIGLIIEIRLRFREFEDDDGFWGGPLPVPLLPAYSGSSFSGINLIPVDNGVWGGDTDSPSSMTRFSAEMKIRYVRMYYLILKKHNCDRSKTFSV